MCGLMSLFPAHGRCYWLQKLPKRSFFALTHHEHDCKSQPTSSSKVKAATSGEALSDKILNIITSLRLDPTKMRSQCYDGA
ncbi:hypothetical protein DPMN_012110, partial [Dreissena polymorpha]